MFVTALTFHELMSSLKDVRPNMLRMFFTFLIFHEARSPLILFVLKNAASIVSADSTFQAPISFSRETAPVNINAKSVALLTSQLLRFWLNVLAD